MKTRYFIQSGIQTDIALESSKYREEVKQQYWVIHYYCE
jgi:hypothetical protein